MEYLKIGKNKIIEHICTRHAKKEPYVFVKSFNGLVGDPINWYNDKWERIPDEELVNKGIRQDNRGNYYHIETKEKKVMLNLDESLDSNWTKEEPFEFCKWDSGKWVLDKEAQAEAKQKDYKKEKSYAMQKAINKKSELEILGDSEAIAKSKAYYADLLEEIEEKYS